MRASFVFCLSQACINNSVLLLKVLIELALISYAQIVFHKHLERYNDVFFLHTVTFEQKLQITQNKSVYKNQ